MGGADKAGTNQINIVAKKRPPAMPIKNYAHHGVDPKRKVLYRNFHDVDGTIYLVEISRNAPKPMTSNELPTTQTATHKTTNFMNMNNKMLNPPMVCVHQVTQTVLVQQMKRWVLCKRWTPWKLTTMMKLKTKKRDMAREIKLTIMEIVM